MPVRSPTFPARYTKLIIEHLVRLGPAAMEAVAAAGLDPADFTQARASIPLGEIDLLLAAIEAATGRRDVGFEVGRRINLGSHDVLGLAMGRCETADQILRLTARHFDLVTPSFVLEYARRGEFARIVFRPVAAMTPRVLHMLNEIHAVSTRAQLGTILGDRLPAYDLYLAGEPPPHAARYETLAPARVHFGALPLPEVHLVLPAAAMDLRLPGADRRAVQIAESRCRKMPPVTAEAGKWGDWVAMILREAVDVQPTLEKLAALLSVTPRTLNRHLAREGEGFRDLAARVRHERACARLGEGRRPISDIAYELGYSDVANFSHAFRTMAGMSPRAWRQSALSRP